jgi:hypothetical protein
MNTFVYEHDWYYISISTNGIDKTVQSSGSMFFGTENRTGIEQLDFIDK